MGASSPRVLPAAGGMGWREVVAALREREEGCRRSRAASPAFRRKGHLRRYTG